LYFSCVMGEFSLMRSNRGTPVIGGSLRLTQTAAISMELGARVANCQPGTPLSTSVAQSCSTVTGLWSRLESKTTEATFGRPWERSELDLEILSFGERTRRRSAGRPSEMRRALP